MDTENPVIECWACKVLVAVPLLNDRPADLFKCGWCWAINRAEQQQVQHFQHLPDASGCQQQWSAQDHQAAHHHDSLAQQQRDGHGQHMQQDDQAAWPFQDQQHQQYGLNHPQQPWPPLQQNPQQQQPPMELLLAATQPQQQQQLAQRQRCSSSMQRFTQRTCSLLWLLWRWLVVTIVVALVSSIAGTGVILLLPRLCTTWYTYLPNLAFAALLLVNVLFNYLASVLHSPGSVADCGVLPARGPHGEVLQGSYALYSYCRHCQGPKPPAAHHCRTCGMCVVDMDHHCPFINNCVGRGNLRPFLLFLLWTLLAASYVLLMCSVLVWQQWDVVRSSVSLQANYHNRGGYSGSSSGSSGFNGHAGGDAAPAGSGSRISIIGENATAAALLSASTSSSGAGAALTESSSSSDAAAGGHFAASWMLATTGLLFLFIHIAPGWLLATYYLVVASAALLLGVSMLLCSQLSYLSRGVTYIEYLKGGLGGAGGSAGAAAAGGDTIGPSDGLMQQQQQHHVLSFGPASGDFGQTTEQQALAGLAPMQQQQGSAPTGSGSKWQALWCKVQEVLLGPGGSSSSGGMSLIRAVVVPVWKHPVVNAAAAAKKWS